RYACHGNALSFYFPDPDGNYLEMYVHTPWYIPQPHGVPYDLSLPSEEIMRKVEAHCREDPGFMMEADRQKQARKIMPG
ncbi:MAG: glyoxalase, partial [Acidiferrobacteraceae bacterium]|nr:glyoxalase [Acidiferrobacteraceae bacterium]